MPKVLIIEDEAAILEGLKDNLEGEGYKVSTASDGKKGLEKALKENVDIVLLDVMLPGMGGFDVCKGIKSKKLTLPIVMLTAKTKEADKVMGLELLRGLGFSLLETLIGNLAQRFQHPVIGLQHPRFRMGSHDGLLIELRAITHKHTLLPGYLLQPLRRRTHLFLVFQLHPGSVEPIHCSVDLIATGIDHGCHPRMGPAKTIGECLECRNTDTGFVEALAKSLHGSYPDAQAGKGTWAVGHRKTVHLLELELVLIQQKVDQVKYFFCVLKGSLHHQ